MRFGIAAALLLACLVPAAPALAQSRVASIAERAPETLRNGQFVWYDTPELIRASAEPAAISLVISIADQRAYVYRAGRLIAATTVSTGMDGHETPVGEFTILEKKVFHRSNLYSNAPMPYMQRLTWDGVALHAGHLPGYPASHGCIRMPKAFARELFDITAMGGSVTITDAPVFAPETDIYSPPPPLLTADARYLGGESFNVVTMSGEPPATGPAPRPASWVTGPAREIVQPLPAGGK